MLACAARSTEVSDLGSIANLLRQTFDELETIKFATQVPCMEYLSLLIENAILLRTNRAGRVYAGFEKFSRLEPIVDRYLRIADVSERVYIFGVNDWAPPRHPRLKPIAVAPESQMSLEWFVIANSPNYRIALVGKDADGFTAPVLENRTFHAIKTSDQTIVQELAETAEKLVDAAR